MHLKNLKNPGVTFLQVLQFLFIGIEYLEKSLQLKKKELFYLCYLLILLVMLSSVRRTFYASIKY